MGFLVRWLVAFVLLALTFNPTEFNYVRWAASGWESQASVIVLAGLVLLVAYVVFLTAVLRGIGALGVMLVLAVVGGLFVVEALSVIIQVLYFKTTGKRVFLMAPIHHHFEKKGWAEPQIVIRFWIISLILALIGLATLKVR